MVQDIQKYVFSRKDRLMLDANIWLYVYGPQYGPDNKTDIYSRALREMVKNEADILIDALTLAEFVNAYTHKEFNTAYPPELGSRPQYKSYRSSPEFKAIAEDIMLAVKSICERCRKCDLEFGSLLIDEFLDGWPHASLDFNDLLLLESCKNNGAMLVTHDSDFKGVDFNILSAAKGLLG